MKTKPTQHSVKELRSIGVQPDFIVCRSDHEISDKVREKIALFCDVRPDEVLACTDSPSIYEVPFGLYDQRFDVKVLDRLGLPERQIDLSPLRSFVDAAAHVEHDCDVAIVGKYTSLPDAYLSVIEALHHAGVYNNTQVNPQWREEYEAIPTVAESYISLETILSLEPDFVYGRSSSFSEKNNTTHDTLSGYGIMSLSSIEGYTVGADVDVVYQTSMIWAASSR